MISPYFTKTCGFSVQKTGQTGPLRRKVGTPCLTSLYFLVRAVPLSAPCGRTRIPPNPPCRNLNTKTKTEWSYAHHCGLWNPGIHPCTPGFITTILHPARLLIRAHARGEGFEPPTSCFRTGNNPTVITHLAGALSTELPAKSSYSEKNFR